MQSRMKLLWIARIIIEKSNQKGFVFETGARVLVHVPIIY